MYTGSRSVELVSSATHLPATSPRPTPGTRAAVTTIIAIQRESITISSPLGAHQKSVIYTTLRSAFTTSISLYQPAGPTKSAAESTMSAGPALELDRRRGYSAAKEVDASDRSLAIARCP